MKPKNGTEQVDELYEDEGADEGADVDGWMVDGEIFEGKKGGSAWEAMEWVREHIGVRGVKPEDAPSAGAWVMLVHFRDDAVLRRKFFERVMDRAEGSAAGADRFRDDGGELDGMVVEIRKAAREAERAVEGEAFAPKKRRKLKVEE